MKNRTLTTTEFSILGLVIERPGHGYDLEQRIEQRGMREWTDIGFSSIYFILNKLEKRGFLNSEKPPGEKKRKTYFATPGGLGAHKEYTFDAIAVLQPRHDPVLLGMANWPALEPIEAETALRARLKALKIFQERTGARQAEQEPLPDFVRACFEHSLLQASAEEAWVEKLLLDLGAKNDKS